MKPFSLLKRTLAFAIVFFLFSACQPDSDGLSINDAKSLFEKTAETLSLPMIGLPETKSDDLSSALQSVYPVWNNATVSEINGHTLIEVPLSGATKVVGAIVTIKEGQYNISRAACKSYLVLEYTGQEPRLYVETFLQKGKRCTMSAASNRDKEEGFQILSDLDGRVLEKTGFQNGVIRTVSDKHFVIDITRIKDVDYFGYRIAYATTEASTKGGCPGQEEYILCPFCFAGFWGNIEDSDLECPYCGYEFYSNGDAICPSCGKPLDQCACQNPIGTCASCGQLVYDCDSNCSSSPYCPCEGGLH